MTHFFRRKLELLATQGTEVVVARTAADSGR